LAKFYFWVHRDRNLDWKEVDRVRPVLKNLYESIPLPDQDDQVLDPGLYQKRIDLRKQYHKLIDLLKGLGAHEELIVELIDRN
ncbi:MAG: hypothetical protein ACXAE3_15750, partial [Candidatus Kariarchaeaceae archaeon]